MALAEGVEPGRWRHLAILAVLLAPSLWLLATVRPLWRDSDAYNQVTQHPAFATYVGHGPLYCLLARVPLYAGSALERLSGREQTAQFLSRSDLTDTGVFLLIATQHLALGLAAFVLLSSLTQQFWIRLLLAVLFASNPLLYTFAHCVGSESLSAILLLLLGAFGLRVACSATEPSLRAWYSFGVVLYLCLLTRYVNLFLLLLLPLAFILRSLAGERRKHLQLALVAVTLSGGVFWLTQKTTAEICRWGGYQPLSRFGFTFFWRLDYLARLSPAERTAELDRVAARTDSADTRKLIEMLRQILSEGSAWHPYVPLDRVTPTLFPEGLKEKSRQKRRRRNEAMNEMALAFLVPPAPGLAAAAQYDFADVLRMDLGRVTRHLFETTAAIWPIIHEMPELTRLVTFREYNPALLDAIPAQHRYVRFWRSVSLQQMLMLSAAACIALFLLAWRKQARSGVVPYAATIVVLGLAMVASVCLMGGILPRYTLPAWELAWIALLAAIGTISDALLRGRFLRAEASVRADA